MTKNIQISCAEEIYYKVRWDQISSQAYIKQQQMIYENNEMAEQNPAPSPSKLPLAQNSQPLSAYIKQLKPVSNLFTKMPPVQTAPLAPPINNINKSTSTHVKLGIRPANTNLNTNMIGIEQMNPNTNINKNNHVHSKQCKNNHHNHNHNHSHNNKSLSKNWINPSFILCNIALFAYCFTFIYQFIAVSRPAYWILALVIYIILFFMAAWAYYKTVCSQPGPIPFFYAMSYDYNRQQLRKYCMLCKNFKPQRSHHCSTCQKCILNMDHHCPWINNCVGFNNRKYFLLFLFYISISLIYSVTIEIIIMVDETIKLSNGQALTAHYVFKWIVLVISALVAFVLTIFFLYHLGLVLKNTTTLELMIKKRRENSSSTQQKANNMVNPTIAPNAANQQLDPELQELYNNYNVGKTQNFMQVFGQNPLWWMMPLSGDGPKGTGTVWPKVKPIIPNTQINAEMNKQNNYTFNQPTTTTSLPHPNQHQKQIESSVRLKFQSNQNPGQINPLSPKIYSSGFTPQPINMNGYFIQNQNPNINMNYNNIIIASNRSIS